MFQKLDLFLSLNEGKETLCWVSWKEPTSVTGQEDSQFHKCCVAWLFRIPDSV